MTAVASRVAGAAPARTAVLNFATFPTPPGDEGLVDLGPLVGLWYAAVSVQVLRLRRMPVVLTSVNSA